MAKELQETVTARKCARDRSRVLQPVTKKWTKRDAETGEFMDVA